MFCFCLLKETKIEKLKSSLEDAMNSHKKAMDDNERLLNDLKKANSNVRVRYDSCISRHL